MVELPRVRRFRIFDSLTDKELEPFLPKFHFQYRPRNETIFREGEDGDRIYFIESGQCSIHRHRPEGQEQSLGYYGPGEFFGDQALMNNAKRLATVDVAMQTLLIYMEKDDFLQLLRDFPSVAEDIRHVARARERRGRATFQGKTNEEAILYMGHRHLIWLIVRLVPWLLLLPVWVVVSILFSSVVSAFVGAQLVFLLIYLIVAGWFILDWRNDIFVITTKRVLHIEKVILLFEQQVEAPIDKITNVTSEVRGFIGNLINLGDVTIHTAAGGGRILFDELYNFRAIRDMIQLETQRVQERERMEEILRMRQAIRESLQGEFDDTRTPPIPKPPMRTVAVTERFGVVGRMFKGMSLIPPTRLQKGDQIVWRRHILMLYVAIVGPVLMFLVATPIFFVLVFGTVFGIQVPLSLPLSLTISVIGMLVNLVWFWYQYRDWENDVYILTPDRLVDSERKPFWLEEKVRVTTMSQVQNVSFERKNLIENLFNYGTVLIQTAGQDGNLTFDEIPNPREAAAQITDAVTRYKDRQAQNVREQRKREFLDWFGEYNKLLREGDRTANVTTPVTQAAASVPKGP